MYQHVRAELVPPRIKTLAADWQLWDSAQEGTEGTIHIDYDGEYGSERVLIVSGRATIVPDDGSPPFNVGRRRGDDGSAADHVLLLPRHARETVRESHLQLGCERYATAWVGTHRRG